MSSSVSWQFKDFSDMIMIGKGNFGLTYKATFNQNKCPVVIKLIPKKNYHSKYMQMQLKREIEIHSRLKHRYIAEMYGWFQDQHNIYLVLEYCDGSSLFQELKVHKKVLAEEQIKIAMKQLASALAYIHERNVMHRDIKLENVVMSSQGLKLIDFGWSVHSIAQERKTFCGTKEYLPPEIIEDKNYNESVDLYSLGVLFYELIYDNVPYLQETEKQTFDSIVEANLVFPPSKQCFHEDFISESQDLITKMLNPKPKERISIKQVLLHPLLKEVNLQ